MLRIVEPTLLCLSCNTPGFQPRLVQHEDIIRDYSRNTCDASFNGSSPGSIPYSPVKIGDSYENLKRKMQPFPDVRQHLLFVDEISKDDSSCGITEASVHGGNVDNVVSAHVSESAADESIPLATNLHNNDNTPDKNSPARTSDINQTDYSISVALSISKELQSPGQIAVEQNHGAVFVQQ